ncbi:MAG TPA: CBS domain-containing protein [Noviherbaspirillum sp.]|uniref:CBS domain-containing protein n=1 Tax=Noviherbaspirillum sp. TaxID=1926288 RepID=UPI002D30E280|nr:CBS domain-containing protein [Noviherbaspirillum sp.]HYD97169.1 CBS domain-containing protein [Noviherbaspirillum sp.]
MRMVSEVMTRDIRFVTPHENLQRAAQLMDELNVGALPVCDQDRLVGMVTDRDITVRATAAGRNPQEAHVDEVMSTDVRWCFDDQSLEDVIARMADSQVRRIPVLSHDAEQKLVGIVSLGDVVTKAGDGQLDDDVQQAVEKVSSPSQPDQAGGAPATAAAPDGEDAPAQDAKTPIGRTPASGTDSGGAAVPSGGDGGTGARGVGGSATAGGSSPGNTTPGSGAASIGGLDDLGPAGDYSR